MPDFFEKHSALPTEHRFDAIEVSPFQIWRNEERSEMWILPVSLELSTLRMDHVHHFQCDVLSEMQESLGGRSAADERTSASNLDLRIHVTLLDEATYKRPASVDIVRIDVEDTVAAAIAAAIMTTPQADIQSSYTVACMTRTLCARLSQTHGLHANPGRFEDWQLSVLREALEAATAEGTSVASMARRCRLSVCHFSRLFRATFGMPLHRYRVNERIKQAKYFLAETSVPISQIALDCGFADQSSFTRRFTATTGFSPATWRRQFHQQAA